MGDLRSRYDYCLYDYYVIDCKWVSMTHITQFNPVVCKKFITVIEVSNIKLELFTVP